MELDIDFSAQQAKYSKVREILTSPNKKFIVLDGLISAGKTTLIRLLEEKLNKEGSLKVKAIYEPVDLWNSTGALQYFYDDVKNRAYEFQTYTYITRIARVINELIAAPDADVYLLERSIWTDRYIFMALLKTNIGELKCQMYDQWCDLWAYIMPMRVDKWVFLNTSLEESLKRIKVRNREAVSGVSQEYQTALYNKHIEFYNELKNQGRNVLVIDSNLMDDNFIKNSNTLSSIASKVMAF